MIDELDTALHARELEDRAATLRWAARNQNDTADYLESLAAQIRKAAIKQENKA